MADIALRVVGAAVGFVASGYNPKGAFIGYQIGATLSGLLVKKKSPHIEVGYVDDLRLQPAVRAT